MNPTALAHLREKLARNETVFGLWVTLESASITEMAVAVGMDWVVIDAEHGQLDWRDILAHLRCAVRSNTVVLVRLAHLSGELIKRALDIGADGVVIPWIETSEQLHQAVSYAKYPLDGLRGIGAERATAWGAALKEHVKVANENVLVVPIIETVRAARNIQSLLGVPGVNLYFFGPADFASTAGQRGEWETPDVARQLLAVKDAIRAARKHCGVVCTSAENIQQRQEQGFRMLAVGIDSSLLLGRMRELLGTVGRDRPPKADLSV